MQPFFWKNLLKKLFNFWYKTFSCWANQNKMLAQKSHWLNKPWQNTYIKCQKIQQVLSEKMKKWDVNQREMLNNITYIFLHCFCNKSPCYPNVGILHKLPFSKYNFPVRVCQGGLFFWPPSSSAEHNKSNHCRLVRFQKWSKKLLIGKCCTIWPGNRFTKEILT